MKDCTFSQRKVSHDELNLENLHINTDSSNSKLTAAFQNMSKKAPSSTLSSVTLDGKKGVKRKLDFDADGSSDEDSTLRREKGKKICLGDFRRREHSFADTDSNTLSPSKNRPSATSLYSRSSISSSCRRRLFPYDKKIEGKDMQSPLIHSKVDSKQKEIRLSLKKKFPGVPNSEFARSGLLLNLAFSKYNLPGNTSGSDKKSNVSYDFVDHTSTNTRREFVHYNSIEKKNSSFCRSPVFQSIKKVKRRLNLEEQESNINQKETSETVSKPETPSKGSGGLGINTDVSAKIRCPTKETEPYKQIRDISTDENRNSSRSYLSLPIGAKKPQPLNDLFKNSKLRSSLRNKIFDLSTCTSDVSNNTCNVGPADRSCAEVDKSTAHNVSRSLFREGSFSSKNSCNQNNKPKYDRIVVRQDLVQRAKRDAERLKRLSLLSSESLDIQRNSRKISNGRIDNNVSKNVCCKSKIPPTFIEGHLKRFLKDCSEMAKLRLVSNEDDSPEPMSEGLPSTNFNQLAETKDTELKTNSNMIQECDSDNNSPMKNCSDTEQENSFPCIEEANSQDVELLRKKTEFTIENVYTQKNDRIGLHILDDTLNDDDLEQIGQKESISSCSSSEDRNIGEQNLQVEEVQTQELEFANNDCENFQLTSLPPVTKETIGDSVEKKLNRKKRGSGDTLCGRLHMLVNREKSEARIWDYELSKKETTSDVNNGKNLNSPVLFCVEKMWKEFSRLIVLCSRIDSDPTDEFFENNMEEDTGTKISHSVIVIIEPELFPKCATPSSIFRIHPPWRLLYSAALNLQLIFRPTKIEIISTNGKSLSYSDPTLPLNARFIEKTLFCVCHDVLCDCVLPKQYVSVIPPLLSSRSNSNGLTILKSYVQEDVQSIKGVDDLIIMYRLLYAKLYLEFKVLSMDSDFSKMAFGYVLGINDQAEKCCVLVKDKTENLSLVKVHTKVRFTGLIPWKIVPARLVSAFVKYLKLTRLDLISKLDSNDLIIFVLSGQYGRIDPL